MATTSTGPRYAPEDPTLPKPWRGLVDGNTGYLYFWNPETNVTQYERPVALAPPPPPPGPPPPSTPKLASVSVSSSVHLQHSENPAHGKHGGSHGQQVEDPSSNYGQRHGSRHSTGMRSSDGHPHHYDGNGDVGRGLQPKLAPIPSARAQQVARNDSGNMKNGPIPPVNGSHGQSYSSNQSFRSSGRAHGSDPGNAVPADVYRRQHEITILGDNIPPPLTTFESTGFPSEILREARYLLLEELMSFAVLLLCRPFFGGLCMYVESLQRWTNYERAFRITSSWPGLLPWMNLESLNSGPTTRGLSE